MAKQQSQSRAPLPSGPIKSRSLTMPAPSPYHKPARRPLATASFACQYTVSNKRPPVFA